MFLHRKLHKYKMRKVRHSKKEPGADFSLVLTLMSFVVFCACITPQGYSEILNIRY